MAEQRYCELTITNTIWVDPDAEQGQLYLQMMAGQGKLLLPEQEAHDLFPVVE